ncbi:hypothetical protein RIF29_08240 [Crotalaria pallida]|uniref:Cystatin domain-containing protein n=1 Tax=Crotalaria pallida TaxID=3830 RepID=A0AAN9PCM1_CROPI
MKAGCIVLFLIAVVVVVSTSEAKIYPYVPIKNLNDPYVVEIAKFAVTVTNRKDGGKLNLLKIIKGDIMTQPYYTMYRLVLAISDAKNYETVVVESPDNHSWNRNQFTPVEAY